MRCFPSVVQLLDCFPQLTLGLLDVSAGCIQAVVSEDLRQSHQVAVVLFQVATGERVSQQVRINLEPVEQRVFLELMDRCQRAGILEFTMKIDE